MAMFFDDEAYVRCPKCGGVLMHCRAVGTYEPDTKDKTVLNFTLSYRELICEKCGTVAKKLNPLERIRGEHGNS